MHQWVKAGKQFGLLVLIGFGLVWGTSFWRRTPALMPTLTPLPQDSLVQVYFNHSEANTYIEPYRGIERYGDDLEQVVVDAIAQADRSVDIAIQELRLPRVAQALHDRAQAGVRVRVILENDYSRPWSSFSPAEIAQLDERDRGKYEDFVLLSDRNQDGQVSPSESDAFDALKIVHNAQIPWIDDTADGSKGSGLMHHKFLVIDNQTVVTGSTNLTLSGTHGDMRSLESRGNTNNLVVIQSPVVAQYFTEEFNLMWGDGPGGQPDSRFGLQKPYRAPQRISLPNGTRIDLQFAPTSTRLDWSESVNGLIERAIATTTNELDLALFVFSEQAFSDQAQQAHQRGATIRALIDSDFAYRNYSEGLDLLGVALADQRCRYEEGNRPWNPPITTVGVPTLPVGDILHHKFAVIDQQTVITGSHNWSDAANRNNDENLLVIQSPTVAAHYNREFERLYAGATLGVPPNLAQKVQRQRCP